MEEVLEVEILDGSQSRDDDSAFAGTGRINSDGGAARLVKI